MLRGWTPPSTNRCHQYFRSHQCPTLPKLLFNPSSNFHITYARARPVHITPSPSHSETGKSMEYKDLITDPSTRATWLRSAANEFGRLAQGLSDNRVEPTNTIFFIPRSKVPKDKRPTYARFVCSYRPKKLNHTAHASP